MGIFGWSLPPGVSMRDIDPGDQPCEVCGKDIDDCVCPECDVCGTQGDPKCYTEHGMKKTKEQEIAAEEAHQRDLKQQAADEEMARDYLETDALYPDPDLN